VAGVSTTPRRLGRVEALLRQRCPRCREGKIFRGRITMNWFCPVCELRFMREPGYTTVAIELSYLLSVPLLVVLYAGVWLATGWPLAWVAVVVTALYLLAGPGIFRYSRVLWIYVDQAFDPGR
jgi:uncharacterized protein (DUF983 family)